MTVCVAAIASWIDEDGKRRPIILLAADRMLTSGGGRREYELRDQTKLIWLDGPKGDYSDKIALMVSGIYDDLDAIGKKAGKRMQQEGITAIADIAAVVADVLGEYRRERVERMHLAPYNLRIDEFVSRQGEFPQTFIEKIEGKLNDRDDDIGDFILAGFDETGAHLYTIHDPGWEQPHDGTGYAAIGIGYELAEGIFQSSLYTPFTDWLQAMTMTFFAKKTGEGASGVGPNTDLWYVLETGHHYFPPLSPTTMALDQMYAEKWEAERQAILNSAAKLGSILVEEIHAKEVTPEPGEQEETPVETTGHDEAGVSDGPEEGEPEAD